jgi:hypothetical protein
MGLVRDRENASYDQTGSTPVTITSRWHDPQSCSVFWQCPACWRDMLPGLFHHEGLRSLSDNLVQSRLVGTLLYVIMNLLYVAVLESVPCEPLSNTYV